ncbi:Uncharacterized protein APZ42_024145 [Daphnia magna]|uniref:Uncharacterized protein n=1 Tax=Daphnia magna TaxID=35525 RepID=A0A162DGD9_9CRUS|nr:Uncharacterized protein APZ42_024145 [Daphnia magna]
MNLGLNTMMHSEYFIDWNPLNPPLNKSFRRLTLLAVYKGLVSMSSTVKLLQLQWKTLV